MNAPAAINRASRIPATSEITQCRLTSLSFPTLALPEAVKQWLLTGVREKLIKRRVTRHGRYVVFQMAEVAVPKELF
jgi:hypothetical protein